MAQIAFVLDNLYEKLKVDAPRPNEFSDLAQILRFVPGRVGRASHRAAVGELAPSSASKKKKKKKVSYGKTVPRLPTGAGKAFGCVCIFAVCPVLPPGGAGRWDGGASSGARSRLFQGRRLGGKPNSRRGREAGAQPSPRLPRAPLPAAPSGAAAARGAIACPTRSDTAQHLLNTFRRAARKGKGRGGGGCRPHLS